MKKVSIHPLFWAILGIGGLTGLFKEIIMLFSIAFIHELGNTYMAYRFNWRIKKITLLPFGGMAQVEEYGNRPVHEEMLVILAGPIQHLWLIVGSFLLIHTPFWTEGDHNIFLFHNLSILLFNLLPILPLDGGKLLFSLLTIFYPFHKAYRINYSFSIMILILFISIVFFIFPFHLNLYAVIMFICLHHYLEWKQRHFMFVRFLLERIKKGPHGKKQIIPLSPTASV